MISTCDHKSETQSDVIGRERKSKWPAIPMDEAIKIVDNTFGQVRDQLQKVVEISANSDGILGLVLAEVVRSKFPVPAFRASIKDGYAVLASDGAGHRRVAGSSTAGASAGGRFVLEPGQCYRITTGAPLPRGADAIIQVEDTLLVEHNDIEELVIDILKAPKLGQDIREIGSDVSVGEVLLSPSSILQAAEIGLVALSGYSTIKVYDRPKVAVLSTGDELVDFYSPQVQSQTEGAVCDTNRPVLLSLFKQNGFDTKDCGIAKDSKPTILNAIKDAFSTCDVLVVTGGVSMGEKDFLKEILMQDLHFKIHFGRIFMKPGLPTTFASGPFPENSADSREKFVFGLPGNPVSAFVTAHLFVVPMLKKLAGVPKYWQTRLKVRISDEITNLDTRPEYRRAVLNPIYTPSTESIEHHSDFIPYAECVPGSQISSRLLSTASANLLLELPGRTEQRQKIVKNAIVNALVIGPI